MLALLSGLWAISYNVVPDPFSNMVPTQGAGTAKLGNEFNVSVEESNWQCYQEESFGSKVFSRIAAENKAGWAMPIPNPNYNMSIPELWSINIIPFPDPPMPHSRMYDILHSQSTRLCAQDCTWLIDVLATISLLIAAFCILLFVAVVCIDGYALTVRIIASMKRIPAHYPCRMHLLSR